MANIEARLFQKRRARLQRALVQLLALSFSIISPALTFAQWHVRNRTPTLACTDWASSTPTSSGQAAQAGHSFVPQTAAERGRAGRAAGPRSAGSASG